MRELGITYTARERSAIARKRREALLSAEVERLTWRQHKSRSKTRQQAWRACEPARTG